MSARARVVGHERDEVEAAMFTDGRLLFTGDLCETFDGPSTASALL